VGLERDPLSLVSIIEELLGRKSSGSGLGNRDYSLYPQKLALTSPTNGGRSVGIVRSRTQATGFSFFKVENCSLVEDAHCTEELDKERQVGR
jgi:hypothetical protein